MSEVFTPTRYKLTVEDFHKLGEVGILSEDSRVELIEGELIEMAPIGAAHAWIVSNLTHLLVTAVGARAAVFVQNPVVLSQNSEPHPDLVLVRKSEAKARREIPGPKHVYLLIEVADTTLKYDRGTKLRLYARAGIREVWIVDVDGRRVEVYRAPRGDAYDSRKVLEAGQKIGPEAFDDVTFDVDDIFA